MRVAIAGIQHLPWAAPGWTRGLRSLGTDVVEWDWTPLYSRGLIGRIERRFLVGPGIRRANHDLVRFVRQHQPDVLLLYGAWPIRPETVSRLAALTWVAGYHNDNPFGEFGKKAYFRYWKQSIPHFHSHHVFRSQNITDYEGLGVKRVKVLLPFYLPWLDVRPEMTDAELMQRAADVVFVGHAEPDHRIAHIVALLSAGVDLRIFGSQDYWKRHLPKSFVCRLPPIHLIEGAEYRKTIAAAKIALSFFSTGNRDEITFRVFEITAVGTFLLCQRSALMERVFREDKEIVFFSSPEELVDKCRFYLQHDELRSCIARAGHKRCLASGYDVITRMRQWQTDTMNWMNESQ